MSIRPIDFQSMIPKNIKMSQDHQFLNNKDRTEHQALVMQDQKSIEKQLHRVNTFDQKAYPQIRDQDHRKSKQDKDRRAKKHVEKEDEIEDSERSEKIITGKGMNIDITI